MSARRTSLIGALLTALGPVSMAIYTPAMPELVQAFSTTEAAIKMSLSLYFAGFAIAQLLAGPMSDAFGRRAATVGFLVIYLVGSILASMAPTIDWILAGRLIQGIGASVGITVARAVVRDQFVGKDAASIMNLIGIMLTVAPAMGPTLGGLSLAAFGWESVFLLMLGFGIISIGSVLLFLKETTTPDRTRLRPARLLSGYAEVLSNPSFMLASLVIGGSIGALYAQATMLPFVLINEVGLTPTQFGVGMLVQTGSYLMGSLVLRRISNRISGHRAVVTGLFFCGSGGLIMALSVAFLPPSFLSIMLPVGICTFGIAFISPHIITVGMAPFPHIAGSASAMMGFVQMGCGFIGGLAAAAMGAPLLAFGTIIPLMEFTAVGSYLAYLAINRRA
ncbi:multidrug effflux MFS transporter [Neorhizobium sp. T786]|uniref:multidrug effflux MFS transporter n=1 Tax=Pseudorhizobium xiangyangii TaxID=2883104 RepID=UPI001CFF991C|nr:multidrug effflux MFS transporter [Neorhizobium xiangyangii]MCB5202496.1 multidrug effflux MFS transporter [Neorhizobium xiangyangii]